MHTPMVQSILVDKLALLLPNDDIVFIYNDHVFVSHTA
jgi:hypothetical protein